MRPALLILSYLGVAFMSFLDWLNRSSGTWDLVAVGPDPFIYAIVLIPMVGVLEFSLKSFRNKESKFAWVGLVVAALMLGGVAMGALKAL